MNRAVFLAHSPLEVGDLVLVKGWDVPATITEIETIYSARSGEVKIKHYVDGWVMPLSVLECRLVDGKRIPIGTERTVCQEVEVRR